MAESPTTGELCEAEAITEDDLVAAGEADMADPTATLFVMGEGYGLNLAEVVRSHPWARTTVASPEASDYRTRGVVRTAILLARPETR
ncbi:hypothetical protein [Methylobacterium planeticum]|uniref:Uncharacterized protein n=1 Tax=Methylobacterium planeticum TaxID=2615211 RepID=A0A6N6MRT0_9HYPH|nr:hypothetical protein [Methylobacterium planeticum]KAB1072947.1 hypothetical protein F6X51_13235 [Methylobacterium planeticum]